MKHLLAVAAICLSSEWADAQCVDIQCPNDTVLIANASCQAVFNYDTPEGRDTCNPFLNYIFTTCGAFGHLGPVQSQIDATYASTTLSGQVIVNGGIQQWIVPATGLYTIMASGAQGGGTLGGRGAKMQGEFVLNSGDTLFILVGQRGQSFNGDVNVGGGGATYVIRGKSNNILLIAGGGGGCRGSYPNAHGTSAQNGQDGLDAAGLEGPGGIGGNGGTGASCRGGGGAGWLTPGAIGLGGCGTTQTGQGGIPFSLGGQGGGITSTGAVGGFGGGGSSEGTNATWTYAGGGGGYSGGGGASEAGIVARAGGGGSFNTGANKFDSSGIKAGDGQAVITLNGNVVTTTQPAGLPSGNAFPLGVTAQTFEATDGSTTISCSFNVTVIDTPVTALGVFVNDTICITEGIQNVPLATPIGGNYGGLGVSGFTFDPSVAGIGTHWIYYTDIVGCPVTDSTSITVESCLGIGENGDQMTLRISPNPGNGLFSIDLGTEVVSGELHVMNTLGKTVLELSFSKRTVSVDLRSEPDGLYFIQLKAGPVSGFGRLIKE